MRKKLKSKSVLLIAALIGSTAVFTCRPVAAGGFVDLEFGNTPTVIGLGIGMVPDYRGSDDYTG